MVGGVSFAQEPFIVTHSMVYQGGVDLTKFGVKANPIIYERYLLPSKTSDDTASKEELQKVLSAVTPGPMPVVLDIERWPTSVIEPEGKRRNAEKLVDVLKKLREIRPDLKYGYYGELPPRASWPQFDVNPAAKRAAWAASNDRMKRDLAPYVDAVFPSLYTFYDDPRGWEAYAEIMLLESKKFGKPIYCYLWPRFHPSNKKMSGKLISPTYWRIQLDTCRRLADGIVIWDNAPKELWDPQAVWWKETEAFLKANGIAP